MTPADFRLGTYIDYSVEHNGKDPKFKARGHISISKQKNVFSKECTSNLTEEFFVIKEVKNTVPWTYVINNLSGEEIFATFYEKK